MSAAGATTTVISACGNSGVPPGVAGAAFDKSVRLATAGPGGRKGWKPGYAMEFLPPEDMPTRGEASDALAGQPSSLSGLGA